MQPSNVHYLPLAPLFFLALVVLFGLAFAFIQIGILSYSYEKMGIDRRYVFGLLLASLFGSYINIPIAQISAPDAVTQREVSFFGIRYVVPEVEEGPRTILAINVGGALIPTVLSIYLMVKNKLYFRSLVAVAIVALVVHQLARPVEGMGIAVPTLVPPFVAALTAVLLSRQSAAPLAYIAGSLGCLIGADVMNLRILPYLGASVASIGGAGTFDGVFLSGVIAVLLAW